jgi:hypothetical protein
MVLYDYSDLSFFAKYTQEVYWGCLGIIAIALLIGIIWSFFREGFFKKLVCLVLCCAAAFGLYKGAEYLKSYNEAINESYLAYKEAEENGQVMVVSGKVENFAPFKTHKEFTLDGVEFKIYSSTTRGGPVRYYRYTPANSYYNATTHNTVYNAESCAVLGDNQRLEIHYIFEEGENRILYIKELSE